VHDFFRGLKVIELASVLAGPSVGQFFAELGARVVKIENPQTSGDVTRSWKLPKEDQSSSQSAYFLSVNWGKEHLFLDLRQEEGYAHVLELIKQADVVLASYKPGDASKLKVDYDRLKTINPKLIYASITGYGKDNPRAGYDAIVQAESGFMYMNGQPGSPPTKMPVALIDVLTAHQLKEGILLALLKREQNGKGSLVEVSLFETGVASLANQALNWLQAGHVPQQLGSEHPNIAPYGTVFYSKDEKPLVLAIGTDRQFAGLCDVLGIVEIAQDELFHQNRMRVINRHELNAKLSSEIGKWTREALLAQLDKSHIPAGAINNMQDLFEIPLARPMILDNGGVPGLKQVAFKIEQ
jgi:crotonobetainyl-CoA:carnitine CoA-transferase CaiB-like acyl-CoA transferase